MVANSLTGLIESGQEKSGWKRNALEILSWTVLSLSDPMELPILSLLKLK
ncbi:hypothetical protein AFAE65S_01571 [Alcaligenes phenolicus]